MNTDKITQREFHADPALKTARVRQIVKIATIPLALTAVVLVLALLTTPAGTHERKGALSIIAVLMVGSLIGPVIQAATGGAELGAMFSLSSKELLISYADGRLVRILAESISSLEQPSPRELVVNARSGLRYRIRGDLFSKVDWEQLLAFTLPTFGSLPAPGFRGSPSRTYSYTKSAWHSVAVMLLVTLGYGALLVHYGVDLLEAPVFWIIALALIVDQSAALFLFAKSPKAYRISGDQLVVCSRRNGRELQCPIAEVSLSKSHPLRNTMVISCAGHRFHVFDYLEDYSHFISTLEYHSRRAPR